MINIVIKNITRKDAVTKSLVNNLNMKRIISILTTIFILLLSINPIIAKDTSPSLISKSAILIDQDTNQIIYSKNIHERRAPASITKVMTALVVIENTRNFDSIITIQQNDVAVKDLGASITGLYVGETLTVKDALACMLLTSGSDAAMALMRQTTLTNKDFIDLMNQKAKSLGLKNTHFTNCFGQYDKDHYSTAYDLSIILQAALKEPVFQEIIKKKEYHFPTNMTRQRTVRYGIYKIFENQNFDTSHITGMKTGSIDDKNVGLNMAVSWKYNDKRFITVTLGAPKDKHLNNYIKDSITLNKWYLKNIHTKIIHPASESIHIKGSIFTPDFKQPIGENISISSTDLTNSNYTCEFVKTNHNIYIKPKELIGNYIIESDNDTFEIPIYSNKWHFSKIIYLLSSAYIIILLFLLFKKMKKN